MTTPEARILDHAVKYIAIIAAIVAAIVLSQFLFSFYQWNQTQTCLSSGRRNCGG